ncbi:MAG: polysaccharide lyase 6 family protein [Woeseia sp.]
MKHLFLVLACLISCIATAKDVRVANQAEYRDALKRLGPGDTIVLADGDWRDFEVLFTGRGQEGKPITLRAETPGKVILSGQSNLRLAGEHLVVKGLVFRDGYTPTNTVIAFRRTKGEYANNSRVTETVIDHFNNPERFEEDYWVMMYGKNNRFDHNHIEGKSNKGVTMAVRLDSVDSQQNHHRIDHNYFGPRPVLGSNGGETLRIGTSQYSLTDSFTVVENNWFDRCDGEVEIISNKSGRNVFRGNLFTESRGTLTLRHGNDNLIENNVFLGNRVPHTGGIRIINKRQTVRNNYLEGLTGHRFGAALTIMNGVPDSPINRYHQVEDSLIENNSVIDSDYIELAAGADEERSARPLSTAFRSNLIYNRDGKNVISVHDDVSGITFAGNVLHEVATPTVSKGFSSQSVTLNKATNGLLYPEGLEAGASRSLQVLDKSTTGVSWYSKPGPDERFDTGRTIPAAVGEGSLTRALAGAEAGDIIELAPGTHLAERILVIDRPLTFRSAGASRAKIEWERSTLFEISQGGSLKLQGLDISGKSAPDSPGNSVIRTHRYSMLNNYSLVINDVEIADLDVNHSFDFFTVAKHTFANRIEILGSVFRNITGHVLFMKRELDDLGIYNGEYVTIANSTFSNVQGAVADVYRGGTDESTFGPHFELRDSHLLNAGNGSRNKSGASISLHGVQDINIHDNVFEQSQPLRITHTVGEPRVSIDHNEYLDTPPPEIGSH